MEIFVIPDEGGRIRLLARAESEGDDEGGIVGDFSQVLAPGQRFERVPFEWWAAHRGGPHNLRQAQREARKAKAPE
jgi:hypothetical protein